MAPVQDSFVRHPVGLMLLQGCDRKRFRWCSAIAVRVNVGFERPLPARRSPRFVGEKVGFKEVCVNVEVLCVYPLVQNGFSSLCWLNLLVICLAA